MTLFVLVSLIGLVLALTVRHHMKIDAERPMGWTPHRDDLLIEGGWTAGGPGGGHTNTIRITRNPDIYAMAFVPAKSRK